MKLGGFPWFGAGFGPIWPTGGCRSWGNHHQLGRETGPFYGVGAYVWRIRDEKKYDANDANLFLIPNS